MMEEVFEKAMEESGVETANGLSRYLNEALEDGISERNLTRYYNFFVLHREKEETWPDGGSRTILARFLGHKDYKAYRKEWKKEHQAEVSQKKEKSLKWKLWGSLTVNGLLLLGLLFMGIKINKKSCMRWQDDRYQKCSCSGNPGESALDLETLEHMRLVKDAASFNGELWYDKSNNKVEFFSFYGKHPINGKTLKKATPYMIETHANDFAQGAIK